MEMETVDFDNMSDVEISNEADEVETESYVNGIKVEDEDMVEEIDTEVESFEDDETIVEDMSKAIFVENNDGTKIFDDGLKKIGVYAKYDENGNITEVNSDIFIRDFTGWTKIDEGYGDRYAHAQSQYFDEPLIDENGNYIHKNQ